MMILWCVHGGRQHPDTWRCQCVKWFQSQLTVTRQTEGRKRNKRTRAIRKISSFRTGPFCEHAPHTTCGHKDEFDRHTTDVLMGKLPSPTLARSCAVQNRIVSRALDGWSATLTLTCNETTKATPLLVQMPNQPRPHPPPQNKESSRMGPQPTEHTWETIQTEEESARPEDVCGKPDRQRWEKNASERRAREGASTTYKPLAGNM